jgi:hypothetical protein
MTAKTATVTVMKKETLVVFVLCSRYTALFEQSIPFWNNMSYSTYIGFQYWKKCTHQESVQPTYIRKDLIQGLDPTYIGPQYNKKTT